MLKVLRDLKGRRQQVGKSLCLWRYLVLDGAGAWSETMRVMHMRTSIANAKAEEQIGLDVLRLDHWIVTEQAEMVEERMRVVMLVRVGFRR
jgi:hypothetical protein